jgi:hypothetical protein
MNFLLDFKRMSQLQLVDFENSFFLVVNVKPTSTFEAKTRNVMMQGFNLKNAVTGVIHE